VRYSSATEVSKRNRERTMPTVSPPPSVPAEREIRDDKSLAHISRCLIHGPPCRYQTTGKFCLSRSAHSSPSHVVILSFSLPLPLPLTLSLFLAVPLCPPSSRGDLDSSRVSFCWSLGTSRPLFRSLLLALFLSSFPRHSLERLRLSLSDNLHLHKWRPNRGVGASRLTATQTRGIINGINTRLPILLRNWVVGYQTAKS